MTERVITSTANSLVKELSALVERRHRESTGRFLVEGRREVGRLLAAGFEVDAIVVSEELGGEVPRSADTAVRVHHLGERAFRKLSRRQNPDGVAARAVTPDMALARISLPDRPLVLVAEGVEKPGNLGAMIRTAEALACHAVVLADPATDPFNPNVIRASQGAVFTVPLAAGTAGEVVEWIEARGITAVAGRPEGGKPPWDIDLTNGVAVVVGSEAHGLGPLWEGSARPVTIPLAVDAASDSLNVATAAALLLYEAVRQRATEC